MKPPLVTVRVLIGSDVKETTEPAWKMPSPCGDRDEPLSHVEAFGRTFDDGLRPEEHDDYIGNSWTHGDTWI